MMTRIQTHTNTLQIHVGALHVRYDYAMYVQSTQEHDLSVYSVLHAVNRS